MSRRDRELGLTMTWLRAPASVYGSCERSGRSRARTAAAGEAPDAALPRGGGGAGCRRRSARAAPRRRSRRPSGSGARLVVPGDDEWPAQLDDLVGLAVPGAAAGRPGHRSAAGLWVRGDGRWTRRWTARWRWWARGRPPVRRSRGHRPRLRARRAGLDRGLRRRVRHRRGRAPGRAQPRAGARWRCWRAASTGRTRSATPPVRADRRERAAGQRVAAGRRAATGSAS